MNQRKAIKRIKKNITAKLWLSNWMDSVNACAMLNLAQFLENEKILDYAIPLNSFYQDLEFENAFKESSKKFYIKRKLFRKIVYENVYKIIY